METRHHHLVHAVFPGSFDPFTVGHENIVKRGLKLFDRITVAVGVNSEKHAYFPLERRLEFIRAVVADLEGVDVATYEGLTVEFAHNIGATHIIRGIRTSADFEFERAIAQVNRQMQGIDTAFLLTDPEFSPVNSSIVRDILRHGGDASMFLPQKIRGLVK